MLVLYFNFFYLLIKFYEKIDFFYKLSINFIFPSLKKMELSNIENDKIEEFQNITGQKNKEILKEFLNLSNHDLSVQNI